jgi:hypothetical protein
MNQAFLALWEGAVFETIPELLLDISIFRMAGAVYLMHVYHAQRVANKFSPS